MLNGGIEYQTSASKGYGMTFNATKASLPTDDDSLASLTDTIALFTILHMADHDAIIAISQQTAFVAQ